MGVRGSAMAGIGIHVVLKDLPKGTVKVVYSCEHPERVGKAFCPTCGKKVSQTNEEDNPFDALYEFIDGLNADDAVPEGYLVTVTNSYSDHQTFFIGFGLEEDDEMSYENELPPYDEIKTTIKELVAKVKEDFLAWFEEQPSYSPEAAAKYPEFYDESKFGLYCVMIWS